MNNQKINKTEYLDFSVENIVMLLWNRKWIIVIVTLLFIGLGCIIFNVTKKPQSYKYITELTLKYQLDTGKNQNTWVSCEGIPWKMVRIDYSEALSDSVFLEKLVANGVLENANSLLPVIVDSSDSLHIVLSMVASGENDSAVLLLQKINELFPSYIAELQKNKLNLEIYLLNKKRDQVLALMTDKGLRLQDLLNKKNVMVADRMEILRLENECQMLYNLGLDLIAQISNLQIFFKDNDLLVLKPTDGIEKELVGGGLFSHLSMFILLFAFLGFMIIVNFLLLRTYLLGKYKNAI